MAKNYDTVYLILVNTINKLCKYTLKYIKVTALILLSSLVLCCSNSNPPKENIFFDFESDSELDEVHWKCHTLMSISNKYATHGKGSLKLELYPSSYPGFNPFTKIIDWSPFKSLCFDIYNPDENEKQITVRVDDKEYETEYSDRYNKSFVIKTGMNHIEIRLDSLITSGTKRKMDTSEIYKFLFFMHEPSEKVVLYVDYIRLKIKDRLATDTHRQSQTEKQKKIWTRI